MSIYQFSFIKKFGFFFLQQHSDTKSEMSQSQSDLGTAITETRSRRRTMSRMSALTLGAGRQKRASVSSLPPSLLNLGDVRIDDYIS